MKKIFRFAINFRITLSDNRIFGDKTGEVELRPFTSTVLEFTNFENISSEVKDDQLGPKEKP